MKNGLTKKLRMFYNNCEIHKMSATKIPMNACGMRDGLSVDMLALSHRSLVYIWNMIKIEDGTVNTVTMDFAHLFLLL